MDTQTQIDRLIELAIVQRAELKKLVSELPQLREHLNAEIERVFESTEPQLRTELEDWTTKQAHDQTVKLGGELEAKIVALSKSLEATTQTRYNAIMAERAENLNLLAKAEARIEDAAAMLSGAVKEIVTDELARFPRAGEIDQLRKEFAEPRGLNPRGRWEPGATYYKLDLVAYNGDSYVANEETSEKPNRNSSKWTLNAARGQAGGGGFMSPAIGDYTASMITNVPAGVITSTNVQDAINELAADVDVSQNTLDALVTNAESVAITKGQVVYAFGATGNRMSVKLALNTGDATSAKTIGVVLDSSIAAGATGNIRCVGVVDGLTLGSYTEGDTVYLGATAGSITATKPYAPNHLVYVGIVERANNGNGELYVKIQNGYELDEIHDVQITSAPLAGALLMRDATNSLWKANRLTGTTNQVTVTNADTAVTLSLPTSLASVDSITASASTALTLTGGSTGASLVLGQGSNAASFNRNITVSLTPSGNPELILSSVTGTPIVSLFGTGPTAAVDPFVAFPTAGNLRFGTATGVGAAGAAEKVRVTNTGNLLIGTATDAANLSGGLVVNGSGTAAAASSTTTGALRVTGGVGVSGAGYFGGDLSLGTGATGYLYLGSTFHYIRGGSGIKTIIQGSSNGVEIASLSNFNVANTTSASSSTVGALTIGNGAAATNVAIGGGAIFAGGGISSLNNTNILIRNAAANGTALRMYADASDIGYLDASANTSLNFQVGSGTKASISSTGVLNVSGTTSASSSTTGTVTIGNGTAATNVAIGGGRVDAGDSITAGNGTAVLCRVNAAFPGTLNITAASNVTTDLFGYGDGTRHGLIRGNQNGANIADFRFGYWGASTFTESFRVTTSGNGVGNASTAVNIYGTTPSTGSTSGALQVAGGIYAGENSVFAGDRLLARKDQNAVSRLQVRNDTSGTSAQSQVSATLGDFTTYTAMGSLSAGFTTSGLFAANAGYIASNAAAGLNLFTVGATSLTLGTNSTAALTLASTGAATFASAVSIGNTVGTAAAVASTHKVTMVIGGVTYYLLATNVP